eukprot:768185-Hanusia_phi.AAC.4
MDQVSLTLCRRVPSESAGSAKCEKSRSRSSKGSPMEVDVNEVLSSKGAEAKETQTASKDDREGRGRADERGEREKKMGGKVPLLP